MPANLENLAVATGLKKVSFHSKPKERQCQRMFKPPSPMLLRLCSKSCMLGFSITWTKSFQMCKLGLEKAVGPEIKVPTSVGSLKKQEFQESIYFCFTDYTKPLTVWITTNCGKFLKRWYTYNLTCLLRNLYAGQEATVRTRNGTMNWFKIGKGVFQGYILSSFLFNLYAEYIK